LTAFAQDYSDTITADHFNSAEILLDEILYDVRSIGKFIGINRVPIIVLDVLSLPSESSIVVNTP